MRIAYIVHNDTHGDARVLKYLDSAAENGHEARLFAVGGGVTRFPPGEERRPSGGVIVRLGPRARTTDRVKPGPKSRRRWLQLGLRQWTFALRAAVAVRRWKPDVVHAHDADTLFAALLVRLVSRVPFVYDAHEIWEAQTLPPRIAAYYRWILDRASSRWAGTITVSPGIQRWMVDRFSLDVEPTLVRNVPVAASLPAPGAEGLLRASADIPEGARLLVHVGLIGPRAAWPRRSGRWRRCPTTSTSPSSVPRPSARATTSRPWRASTGSPTASASSRPSTPTRCRPRSSTPTSPSSTPSP